MTAEGDDEDKMELMSKPMKYQFWVDNLTLVHALLAVPQQMYKLKPAKGKQRKYIAEFTVGKRFWYTDLELTLPETNEPPVTATNLVFKLN